MEESKPAIWNPDKALEGVFVRRAGTGLMTTRGNRKTARSAGKNCPGG